MQPAVAAWLAPVTRLVPEVRRHIGKVWQRWEHKQVQEACGKQLRVCEACKEWLWEQGVGCRARGRCGDPARARPWAER